MELGRLKEQNQGPQWAWASLPLTAMRSRAGEVLFPLSHEAGSWAQAPQRSGQSKLASQLPQTF